VNAGPSASVDQLTPAQVAHRLERVSIAYLPLGSLEFHGPHLPIGLDALTARGVCLAAAERTGGIVLPVLHHATGGEHTDYPWTIMSRSAEPIETLLVGTLRRLEEMGVRRAVILSGHFASEQRDLLERIDRRWNGSSARLRVVARTLDQAPATPVPADHAAQFETLLLLALDPGLVHLDRLPDADDFPVPPGEDPFGGDRHRPGHPLHGVFGPDPRRMDQSAAAPLLDHLVSWAAGLARGTRADDSGVARA
jgi:creatinine amidohydrolase